MCNDGGCLQSCEHVTNTTRIYLEKDTLRNFLGDPDPGLSGTNLFRLVAD